MTTWKAIDTKYNKDVPFCSVYLTQKGPGAILLFDPKVKS